MSLTNYARNKMNDHLFGGISFTPPTNFWMALSTTNISVSGSNVSEPVGAGYARVLIPNDKSHFSYSTSGCLTVSGSTVYAISSGSFGTVLDIAFFDALSSGSAWMFSSLPSPYIVQNNTVVSFDANTINISQT
jgi:hypothetical protein